MIWPKGLDICHFNPGLHSFQERPKRPFRHHLFGDGHVAAHLDFRRPEHKSLGESVIIPWSHGWGSEFKVGYKVCVYNN